MKAFIYLIMLFLIISFSSANELNEKVKETITIAHSKAIDLQIEGKKWDLPSYLGNNWASTIFLFLKWKGNDTMLSHSDIKKLKFDLLNSQNENGSWTPIYDANNDLSDLSATIINYFALKVMDQSLKSPSMLKAHRYILSKGGIEKSNMITKIFLALFDNYSWDKLPKIPLAFFTKTPISLFASSSKLAQWVSPNLAPIAYLKRYQVHKNLGDKFNLNELFTKIPQFKNENIEIHESHLLARHLMNQILDSQKVHGSFGAYVPATFFSYAALTHYENVFPSNRIDKALENAISFFQLLTIRNGKFSTQGIVDDGHVWDTALISLALSRTNFPIKSLRATGDYLASTATEDGGYPFGADFEEYPDTDDTAIIILSLTEIGGYDQEISKAVKWLISMQSRDGGWGAFAKNNTGNLILRKFAGPFEDSADLFDESSPDVTGHILEALGKVGYTKENSSEVRRAISYLKKEVNSKMPAWMGRWGVNYIYGTGAVLSGLFSVHESMTEEYIVNARKWLISKQNADGGFGESTKSYLDDSYAGIGISTSSQTAWGLLGLLKTGNKKNPAVINAVKYLLKTFDKKKGWTDSSTVGTGHPKIVYMNYPSYPVAFPLIALGEYLHQ